ncbi:hypothetical protein [Streptomyces lavendulocolor]|uniref:hypothetical protein n=1 Tax=Streptomyces lavendulocolor TaxID=67316 RepID=UPI003C2C1A4E
MTDSMAAIVELLREALPEAEADLLALHVTDLFVSSVPPPATSLGISRTSQTRCSRDDLTGRLHASGSWMPLSLTSPPSSELGV